MEIKDYFDWKIFSKRPEIITLPLHIQIQKFYEHLLQLEDWMRAGLMFNSETNDYIESDYVDDYFE